MKAVDSRFGCCHEALGLTIFDNTKGKFDNFKTVPLNKSMSLTGRRAAVQTKIGHSRHECSSKQNEIVFMFGAPVKRLNIVTKAARKAQRISNGNDLKYFHHIGAPKLLGRICPFGNHQPQVLGEGQVDIFGRCTDWKKMGEKNQVR